MNPDIRTKVAFHLTGKRLGQGLQSPEKLNLRPALFSRYRDLTALRYDFPLVLTRAQYGGVRSLSSLMNEVMKEIAPQGFEGERLRKRVMRLEREIRTLVAGGASGTLSQLWTQAAARLGDDESLAADLVKARSALKADGDLLDCGPELPRRLVMHLWRVHQKARAHTASRELERLLVRLSDILKSDAAYSSEGLNPDSLRRSFGTSQRGAFDFGAMSKLLSRTSVTHLMPESRRRRIHRVLAVLESQRDLVAAAEENSFVFEDCSSALATLSQRLPGMIDYVKASAIAELEIEGRYEEEQHDAFFEAFDQRTLGLGDMSRFPDYLICLDTAKAEAGEIDRLLEILACGLPVKIVASCDDVISSSTAGDGQLAPGPFSARLASLATGLHEAFVLQCSAADVVACSDQMVAGLTSQRPALFSIFAPDGSDDVPAYLLAAAATQARAFPSFVFDPQARDMADRFQLGAGNPQPEEDWPVESFFYEDSEYHRHSERLAFTAVDFLAADERYRGHFAPVEGDAGLIAVSDWMAGAGSLPGSNGSPEQVPFVLMVDEENILRKVIVDGVVTEAALRCQRQWRALQERAGIHNSYARRAVEQARQLWEEEMQEELEAMAPAGVKPVVAEAADATEAAPEVPDVPAASERDPDEAYIETPRCTTCNECTNINGRMFAYNENKQAYIADLGAGTYRELVLAAESCQVAIIHPGKPRNPNEPDLDDLMKRAEVFL